MANPKLLHMMTRNSMAPHDSGEAGSDGDSVSREAAMPKIPINVTCSVPSTIESSPSVSLSVTIMPAAYVTAAARHESSPTPRLKPPPPEVRRATPKKSELRSGQIA